MLGKGIEGIDAKAALRIATILCLGLCAFGCSTASDSTEDAADGGTTSGAYSSAESGVSLQDRAYSSSTSDVPAVKVSPGGSLTLSSSTIVKSGATANRENSGFYGFNSGALASSSSSSSGYSGTGRATTLTMTDCEITTSASGANGAFAFGEDAVVNLSNVAISTKGSDNSRGVDATYGGTVNVSDSTISTTGGSCAALATDRYENYDAPSINATNCTGTTAGSGSPCIYCTGTFTVTGCSLAATGSEAVVVEGLNSVALVNSSVSGAAKWGVMIYQSMSGDSSVGTGAFSMTGGSLTNGYASGPLFFVCNTSAAIVLDGATIQNASGTLLVAGTAAAASSVLANVNSSWGTKGGTVAFTATDQALEGDIVICDSSSSIALTLESSTFSGAVNNDNTGCAATVVIDSGSAWTVTGDSYLTSLTNDGTIDGAGTVYVNGAAYAGK